MNVYEKLNEARAQFHKASLKKSGRNKFADYYYFELGDFVVPALQIFRDFGLTSVISFKHDEATMQIINTEDPAQVITISTPMSEASLKGCHPVQNLGAVQTYLRRYLWVAALEIVEHDALDSSKPVDKPVEEVDEKKIVAGRYEETPKHAKFLEVMMDWGNTSTSVEELTNLWKANQQAVDEMKAQSPALFKQLQAHFATLKANLQGA